jgi:hypothetical protein
LKQGYFHLNFRTSGDFTSAIRENQSALTSNCLAWGATTSRSFAQRQMTTLGCRRQNSIVFSRACTAFQQIPPLHFLHAWPHSRIRRQVPINSANRTREFEVRDARLAGGFFTEEGWFGRVACDLFAEVAEGAEGFWHCKTTRGLYNPSDFERRHAHAAERGLLWPRIPFPSPN